MRLFKLFQLLLICAIAMTGLAAHARVAENVRLEKFSMEYIDCARVWAAQAQYAPSEDALFSVASMSGATVYNYFRSYQPNQGRYTQNDPIGLDGGWNRFGYVEGNPLSLIDPEGLQGRGNVTPGGPGAQYRYVTLGGNAWGAPTHQHHSGPMFMGFPANQQLTTLPRETHNQLHRDLNNFLRTQTNEAGQHMRPQSNNSGASIRENFSPTERWNALREFYNRYGEQYPWAARDFFRQFPDQNFCGR